MMRPPPSYDNYHTHQANDIIMASSVATNNSSDPSSVNTSTSTLSQSLNGLNNVSFMADVVNDAPCPGGDVTIMSTSLKGESIVSKNLSKNKSLNNKKLNKSENDLSTNLDIESRLSTLQRKGSVDTITSRGTWGNKWEFLLSCVGLSVGIGNVWRFPYLAYENGGGAFLIPYLIMLFLAGKPMYFMELALGQFGGVGPISIWTCAPIMKGVGVAMILSSIVVCIYYNVVMSYAIYFIGQTFQSRLPWTRCDVDWAIGTNCYVRSKDAIGNYSLTGSTNLVPASQIFWERKVLDISNGITEMGGVKWDLALCLAISWIIVIACLAKGIKTSGKVIYFAATFPYAVLLTLLVMGLTQTGAWEGVKYFITPDFSKLLEIKVWQAAAGQMFFSLSIAMGGLIMFSSYNDFKHNIFQDAMVVSFLDTITSIISGIVIFSVLGALSHEMGIPIAQVAKSGPGLAFVAYPEALSRLPLPQLWSILFFLMLFILGLDSEFALLENIITATCDEVPYLRKHKLLFTITTGFTFFVIGLTCVTRGGQFIFNLLDHYGGSLPLLFLAIFECIGLMWVYGYNKFSFDVYYMLERKLGLYWMITWKWTSPIVLSFICAMTFAYYKPLTYGDDYFYPDWATIGGWTLTAIIIGQIPLWAIYAVLKQSKGNGLIEKIKLASKEADGWGPRNEMVRKDWRTKKTGLYGVNIISRGINSDPDSFNVKEAATLKRFSKLSPQLTPSLTSPASLTMGHHDSSSAAIVNHGYVDENGSV